VWVVFLAYALMALAPMGALAMFIFL
jgi:hypothetical protein